MSWGAGLAASLLVVLPRPATWIVALASFLVRGGILLFLAADRGDPVARRTREHPGPDDHDLLARRHVARLRDGGDGDLRRVLRLARDRWLGRRGHRAGPHRAGGRRRRAWRRRHDPAPLRLAAPRADLADRPAPVRRLRAARAGPRLWVAAARAGHVPRADAPQRCRDTHRLAGHLDGSGGRHRDPRDLGAGRDARVARCAADRRVGPVPRPGVLRRVGRHAAPAAVHRSGRSCCQRS